MSNQREIATALGVSQATVSLALCGHPRISEEMRQLVCKTAKQMGYRPNAYVNAVMTRIRSGKKISDKGVIALLVESRSREDWYEIKAYQSFYQGIVQRGRELGYRTECFFLQAPEMSTEKVERILQARGIQGIIMAPPYHGDRQLKWERYSAVGIGVGWGQQFLNRVTYATLDNFQTAFRKLRQIGYRRIGVGFSDRLVCGHRFGIRWYVGFLDCQNSLPEEERIPAFISRDISYADANRAQVEKEMIEKMGEWIDRWRPEVLLTPSDGQKKWIESLGFRIPQDIGLACLVVPPESGCAGIDERGDVVGATALSQVAAQIYHNEFGLPTHPVSITIDGQWVDGLTLRIPDSGAVIG